MHMYFVCFTKHTYHTAQYNYSVSVSVKTSHYHFVKLLFTW